MTTITNISWLPEDDANPPMIPSGATGKISELHPNQLAQLDAAFRRHHHLACTTGIGDILDRNCRSSNRGRKKKGLDGNVYYALLLTAVFSCHQGTVQNMYTVSRTLPLITRLEFGIARAPAKNGTTSLSGLTIKQLYTMTEGLKKNLDFTNPELDEQQRTQRHKTVCDITARGLAATHLIDIDHGTYAIDDTAIWSWARGPKQPKAVHGGPDRPLTDEDFDPQPLNTDGEEATEPGANEADGDAEKRTKQDPSPWQCPDASWSGKTGKDGKMQAFFGYKAHVIVNTNNPNKPDTKDSTKTRRTKEKTKDDYPILVQALELTTAKADIVDVSLRLIDQIRLRNNFHTIVGDRHYSFKKFERWAMQLWQRRIHQVLDLRADKPQPVDQLGALIIDGAPHCPATPTILKDLERPEDKDQREQFRTQIAERKHYALRLIKSPFASPTEQDDAGVGKTRHGCPARAGRIGCPLVEGSITNARKRHQPIVQSPPQDLPLCCSQSSIQIPPNPAMKYFQEHPWGSAKWEKAYALRQGVEGVFGNLKNDGTEGVRRGFVQVTGLPLVSLAIGAAAICYNIRILEKHLRETDQHIDSPLLNHPLDDELIENIMLRGDEVTAYVEELAAAA